MRCFQIILSTLIVLFTLTSNAFAISSSPPSFKPVPVVAATKVNLNQATEKDLLKIKGLSKTNVHAILNFHKKKGDFKSLDDLKKISSFSKMKATHLKAIQDQLTI